MSQPTFAVQFTAEAEVIKAADIAAQQQETKEDNE